MFFGYPSFGYQTRYQRLRRALACAATLGTAACGATVTEPPALVITCEDPSTITPRLFQLSRSGVLDPVVYVNRFAIPYHWADTIPLFGGDALLIAKHGGRCTTLSDSLVRHAAVATVVVPQ